MISFIKMAGGFVLKLLGGGLGKQAINGLLQAQKNQLDAQNEEQRIAADTAVAFWQEQVTLLTKGAAEGTERQKWKMNHKVFWFILCTAMLPGLGTYFLLSVYNVLWHKKGIWPQNWEVAAFPAPYNTYLQMSMEWIFDPMQLAMTTAIATGVGFATGRRK